MTRPLVLPAALVALLALPSAALGAYAPKLEVKFDPAEPDKAAALTTTVTQAPGETASKTVRVQFPRGVGANVGSTVSGCEPAQADARACPPESQVGQAHAVASIGNLDGPVHLITDPGKVHLAMFLEGGPGGLVEQRIDGLVTIQPDGSFLSTFDGLPDVATTVFELKFMAGEKALVRTPRTCGSFKFTGLFTSHRAEEATSEAPVEIKGCAAAKPPEITGARVRPKRFRAVRTAADRDRRGYGTTLFWTLSEDTDSTRVRVERRVRGRGFRRVSTFTATGDGGNNQVEYEGRGKRGKPLAPGSYRFVLDTTNAAGLRSAAKRVSFTVLRPRR